MERVILTTGCFDVLHVGHVQLFRYCRQLGDFLVVGINSDKRIRELKGRLYHTAAERVEILLALEPVNRVIVFQEDEPSGIIERVQPAVFVKGEDWYGKKVSEQAVLDKLGVEVHFAPLYMKGGEKASTTNLLRTTGDERN